MFRLLCHAVHSSLQNTEPVATFMLLPQCRDFSCDAYMSWLNRYPDLAKVLAKFPAENIRFRYPNTGLIPFPTPSFLLILCDSLLSGI
eukprot:1043719-Pelagomonas_calceolata.AAC.1